MNGSAGSSTQARVLDGFAALRVLFGLLFLANGLAKLVPGLWNTPLGYLINADAARDIVASEVRRHPIPLYRDVMEGVILTNWSLVAPLLATFEILVGGLLLAGVATRWAALAGALFALHLHFMTVFNGRWLFEFALIWVPLLVLASGPTRSIRFGRAGGGES